MVLNECSELFSNHYGKYRGSEKRITLKARRLKADYLFDPSCGLVTARVQRQLVGHLFLSRFVADNVGGAVCWVTQLVVQSDFRRRGIACTMLHHAVNPSDVMCALVTSHPHAVRALENAHAKICDPEFVKRTGDELLAVCPVPYLRGCKLKAGRCVVDTNFDADHTGVLALLENDAKWTLGLLEDKEEFLAIIRLKDPPVINVQESWKVRVDHVPSATLAEAATNLDLRALWAPHARSSTYVPRHVRNAVYQFLARATELSESEPSAYEMILEIKNQWQPFYASCSVYVPRSVREIVSQLIDKLVVTVQGS